MQRNIFGPFISSRSRSDILKAALLINLIDFRLLVPCGLSFIHCAFIRCRHPRHFFSRKDGLFPLSNLDPHTLAQSCPNAWNPNSTFSPSATGWPQPDTHFNQLLHQRHNPRWNLTPLFSWCPQTHRSEDGRWQRAVMGGTPYGL